MNPITIVVPSGQPQSHNSIVHMQQVSQNWQCPRCTLANGNSAQQCTNCHTPKPNINVLVPSTNIFVAPQISQMAIDTNTPSTQTSQSTPSTVHNVKEVGEVHRAHKFKAPLDIGRIGVFGDYESPAAIAWLSYTALYWTLLTWIPILIRASFAVNLLGFVFWCLGCIGMMSVGYALWHSKYPSGAVKDDIYANNVVGRYSAAILTSVIVVDCFYLVYFSVDFDNINDADTIIYDTNLSRLIFHLIHIFWSSLFFVNKYIAVAPFTLSWINIVWNCIVSFTVTNAGDAIDIIYFLMVGFQLIFWMGPMMFNKTWTSTKYANQKNVFNYLLLFTIFTNFPIIVTILATQAYESNAALTVDLVWKSFLLQLSSIAFVKQATEFMYKDRSAKLETEILGSSITFKFATYVWVGFVVLYWSVCVLARCIVDGEIAENYQYYTWFFGVAGLLSLIFANNEGFAANTKYGQSLLAVTCLCLAIDCVLHAYELLAGLDDTEDVIGEVVMVCHCLALVTSLVFYSAAFQNNKGIGYSIILQWIDIIVMFIVIEILHSYYKNQPNLNLYGASNCFSESLCEGYFAIFIIKIVLTFVPIIFNTTLLDFDEPKIHVYMVFLNTVTTLPLMIIVLSTKGYGVNPFVFFDVIFKVIILLISYSYHLVINLILKQCE